jgi:molybdopterin-binding protein
MSQIVAIIKKIDTVDSLNIVQFDFLGINLKMMSLDLNKEIQVGKKVRLGVKSTNICIAKNLIGEISLSNKIIATIQNIQNGELLSSITLKKDDILMESIITLDSSKRMDLKENDEVTLLIKASDLSILEVIND